MFVSVVTFQNSFYSRAFNTLPDFLRDNTNSMDVFKTNLRAYYLDLTLNVYDPAVPQTFKSVCIKCHRSAQIITCMLNSCQYLIIML